MFTIFCSLSRWKRTRPYLVACLLPLLCTSFSLASHIEHHSSDLPKKIFFKPSPPNDTYKIWSFYLQQVDIYGNQSKKIKLESDNKLYIKKDKQRIEDKIQQCTLRSTFSPKKPYDLDLTQRYYYKYNAPTSTPLLIPINETGEVIDFLNQHPSLFNNNKTNGYNESNLSIIRFFHPILANENNLKLANKKKDNSIKKLIEQTLKINKQIKIQSQKIAKRNEQEKRVQTIQEDIAQLEGLKYLYEHAFPMRRLGEGMSVRTSMQGHSLESYINYFKELPKKVGPKDPKSDKNTKKFDINTLKGVGKDPSQRLTREQVGEKLNEMCWGKLVPLAVQQSKNTAQINLLKGLECLYKNFSYNKTRGKYLSMQGHSLKSYINYFKERQDVQTFDINTLKKVGKEKKQELTREQVAQKIDKEIRNLLCPDKKKELHAFLVEKLIQQKEEEEGKLNNMAKPEDIQLLLEKMKNTFLLQQTSYIEQKINPYQSSSRQCHNQTAHTIPSLPTIPHHNTLPPSPPHQPLPKNTYAPVPSTEVSNPSNIEKQQQQKQYHSSQPTEDPKQESMYFGLACKEIQDMIERIRSNQDLNSYEKPKLILSNIKETIKNFSGTEEEKKALWGFYTTIERQLTGPPVPQNQLPYDEIDPAFVAEQQSLLDDIKRNSRCITRPLVPPVHASPLHQPPSVPIQQEKKHTPPISLSKQAPLHQVPTHHPPTSGTKTDQTPPSHTKSKASDTTDISPYAFIVVSGLVLSCIVLVFYKNTPPSKRGKSSKKIAEELPSIGIEDIVEDKEEQEKGNTKV